MTVIGKSINTCTICPKQPKIKMRGTVIYLLGATDPWTSPSKVKSGSILYAYISLIIYCCCHKFSSWKHSFIISQFYIVYQMSCYSMPQLGLSLRVSQGQNQDVGRAVFLSAFKHTLMGGRIKFLVVVGLEFCFLPGCQLGTTLSSLRCSL